MTTFDFNSNSIRVIESDGTAWFFAVDVCRQLELKAKNGGYGHHLKKLDADGFTSPSDMGVKVPGNGAHNSRLVSESGLYKLVNRSDKPKARAFQNWVAREVLPSIRKTGAYMAEVADAPTQAEAPAGCEGRTATDHLLKAIAILQAENTELKAELVQQPMN